MINEIFFMNVKISITEKEKTSHKIRTIKLHHRMQKLASQIPHNFSHKLRP
jgi:hypothetical protein